MGGVNGGGVWGGRMEGYREGRECSVRGKCEREVRRGGGNRRCEWGARVECRGVRRTGVWSESYGVGMLTCRRDVCVMK